MYIKDMAWLGRDLKEIILLDNSPISYLFQPENGMPIKNWYDDRSDTELSCYVPILEKLAYVDDVRKYLLDMHGPVNNICFKKARQVLSQAEYVKTEELVIEEVKETTREETKVETLEEPEEDQKIITTTPVHDQIPKVKPRFVFPSDGKPKIIPDREPNSDRPSTRKIKTQLKRKSQKSLKFTIQE